MRRLAYISLLGLTLLPGLAAAQSAANPPPPSGANICGPGVPPPGGGWMHDRHEMMKKWQDKFNAANTTHDGHLTLAQAQAAGLKPVVDHFNDIDTHHRGYVTFNEVQAWHLDAVAQRMEQKAAALRAQD